MTEPELYLAGEPLPHQTSYGIKDLDLGPQYSHSKTEMEWKEKRRAGAQLKPSQTWL